MCLIGLSAGKFDDIEGQTLSSFFQSGVKSSVDVFDQISSPGKPAAAVKPVRDMKSFIKNSQSVDPFDSFVPPAGGTEPSPSKPVSKPTNISIKSFVSNSELPDPFDSLKKSNPRISDEEFPILIADVPSTPKYGLDMRSYTSSATAVDPFKLLEKSDLPVTSSAKTSSTTSSTSAAASSSIMKFVSSGKAADPFDVVESNHGKSKTSKNGIKQYFTKSRVCERLADMSKPKITDSDILEVSVCTNSSTLTCPTNTANEQTISTDTKETSLQVMNPRIPGNPICESPPTSTLASDCLLTNSGDEFITISSQDTTHHSNDSTCCDSHFNDTTNSPHATTHPATDTSYSDGNSTHSHDYNLHTSEDVLDSLIDIWTDDTIDQSDNTCLEQEADMSFFEAVEIEQRMFHQLDNQEKVSSESEGMIAYANADSKLVGGLSRLFQRSNHKYKRQTKGVGNRKPRRPREPRQTRRHGLTKRLVRPESISNSVIDENTNLQNAETYSASKCSPPSDCNDQSKREVNFPVNNESSSPTNEEDCDISIVWEDDKGKDCSKKRKNGRFNIVTVQYV